MPQQIQLVTLDPAIGAALMDDPAYFGAMVEEDWATVADTVHRHVGRTLTATPVTIDELDWDGYTVVNKDTREVVGACAFKSPPDEEGVVEIAYFTYPDFEGHGYATQMASKLVELAADCESVRRVIAHTLPEDSASTAVLKKVGMRFVGEVVDPEDGRVWRWEWVGRG